MHIIWKKRERLPSWDGTRPSPTIIAYATAAWREGGRIRRRCRYLASIREGALRVAETRDRFWQRADAAFDRLDLAPDVRARLEERVNRRVPRPSLDDVRAELEALHRARIEFWRQHRPGT